MLIDESTWPTVTAGLAALLLIATVAVLYLMHTIRKESASKPNKWYGVSIATLTVLTLTIAVWQKGGYNTSTTWVRLTQTWISLAVSVALAALAIHHGVVRRFFSKKREGLLRGILYFNAGFLMLITAAKVAMGLGVGEVSGIIRDFAVEPNIFLSALYMPAIPALSILGVLIIGIKRLIESFRSWRKKRKAEKAAKQQAATNANAAAASAATGQAPGRASVPVSTGSAPPQGSPSRSVAHRGRQRLRATRRPASGNNSNQGNPPAQGGSTTT